MIEAPHPVHTHSRSTSFIYKVFQHLLQWLVVVIRMQPQPDICLVSQSQRCSKRFSWFLTCSISYEDMIKAPHPLHTHVRSSPYIYTVFQNLLPWPVASDDAPTTLYMFGFTVMWQSLESILLVSHLQCAVGYNWGNPSAS
jgi:hypothetical protein